MLDFSHQLRKWMRIRGINQTDLARKCDMKPASINQYVNDSPNSKTPNLRNLIAIARGLNVTINGLLGLDESVDPLANEVSELPDDDWRREAIRRILCD